MTQTIAPELTDLEQLNLDVAAIAGWENIVTWSLKLPKRVYVGTNKKHPELGIFIPSFTSDLNAIVAVFDAFDLDWNIGKDCNSYHVYPYANDIANEYGETPAIALCKLLIELVPNLPKPELEIQVIDDAPEID